ncbi:MAG: DNA primase [Eubacteriales bacterium]|nr:DNA primase [Eubacteriales bacterium]
MALPDGFLYELKERSDISDIVSGYVNLKRRGRNLVGLCPFHSEKTPSFNLYPENGSFYCFGCGAGGDVITFIMKIENLDYIEAVKFLAQRAGMDMPENSYDDGVGKLRMRIFEANREAARFYNKKLYEPEGREGLEYFYRRGLTDNIIRRFGLGYSPKSRYALCDHLKALGFSSAELVAANLAFMSSDGRRAVDRFADRVMFPIIDLRGNVIAFGGRILTDQKPKYLNTSDTPAFKKSANLFSLNNAKNTGERTLILCEGYMDVIALNKAGFKNAVATLGTALTPEQAVLMKRYADEVVICYDADEAGQKATARAITLLRNAGLVIRVLSIPEGKDPDEFIRNKGDKGAAAFKNVLDNSGNDVEYRLQNLKTKYDTNNPEQKAGYMTEALRIVSSLDSAVEQDIYVSKLAGELNIDKASISADLQKLRRKKENEYRKRDFTRISTELSGRDDKVNTEKAKHTRAAKAEEMLIAFLVYNNDMEPQVSARITPQDFVTKFNAQLYAYVVERIHEGVSPQTTFTRDFTSDEVSKFYAILHSYNSQTATKQAMNEYIDVILEEKHKLTPEKISEMSPEEIMASLKKKKSKE